MEIRKDEENLKNFFLLPFKIYKGDPYWVPPLISEVKEILGEKNPFWKHAEKVIFTCYKNGEIVGRIVGIIDYNHINFHKEKCGFFGFFEVVNDLDVVKRLFTYVEEWAKEKGMEILRGPMNPSTNDECALLIEGFASPPFLMMTYNPPYYINLIEKCGYKKAKDLYAWLMPVVNGPVERLKRLSEKVKEKFPKLKVREIDLKNFRREVDIVLDIYNSAWEKNWGFVPMTKEEIEHMAKKLKPLVDPGLLQIAFYENDPAGFLMALPDYNQVIKMLNGRLTPIGIIKLLYYAPKIRTCRLLTLGIKEKYRKIGIDVLLYWHSLDYALKKGYKWCEFSWILEDNILTNRAAEMMGGMLYKRYRIYEKELKNEK